MSKSVHGGPQSPMRRSASEDWTLYAPSGQRKYLNEAERARFIAAAWLAPPQVQTLALTLLHIGCRISEALALTAGDIEPAAGLISVRSLKKRGRCQVRQVPAPPALLAEIAGTHGLTGDPGIDPAGRLWPWGRTRAWQHIKAIMATAQIGQLAASPKGLRHGFGVHAVLSGVPLNLIQRWLGHENIATTAIYTDVAGPEEQAIAARMWRVP